MTATPGALARQQGRWLAVSEVGTRAGQFLSSLILARLLMPEQFGLVTAAVVIWELVALFANTGLFAVVVQRRDHDPTLCRAGFWMNLTVSVGVAGVGAAIALGATKFYAEPLLFPFVCVFGLGFVVRALGAVHGALLTRAIEFRPVAISEIAAEGTRVLLSIALAWRGFGAWSLVLPIPIAEAFRLSILWHHHPFRPGWSLHVSRWRELVEQGRWVVGAALGSYLLLNGSTLVIGRVLGTIALGIYSRAFRFANLLIETGVWLVARVTFPALAALQDEPRQLAELFRGTLRMVGLFAFPASALVLVVAPDAIAVLYGEQKWGAAAPLVRILMPFVAIRALGSPAYQALLALGKARGLFRLHFAMLVPMFGAVYAGSRSGLPWVAAAVSLSLALSWGAVVVSATRATGVTGRRLLAALAPGLLLALVVAGAASAAGLVVTWFAQLPDISATRLGTQVLRLAVSASASTVSVLVVLRLFLRQDFERLVRELGEVARGVGRQLTALRGR